MHSHHYRHFVWTLYRFLDSVHSACYATSCAQHDSLLVLSTQAWLAEQHEQDMLEELDRMHEECATLHEDAKVGFSAACHFHSSMPFSMPQLHSLHCLQTIPRMHLSQHMAWNHTFMLTCMSTRQQACQSHSKALTYHQPIPAAV